MAQPLTVSLPPDIDLWDGCILRVTAQNPSTGATVSGVTVSDVTFQVTQTAGEPAALQVGGWLLVPGPGA